MTQLQIVLLMAGSGQRFLDVGYTTSKPFIEIHGRPMFSWALDNVRTIAVKTALFFAIPDSQLQQLELGTSALALPHSPTIVPITSKTRGPAETLSLVLPVLGENPLLVLDCDVRIVATKFYQFIADVVQQRVPAESALVTFSSQDPRYSYARIKDSRVLETAEKRVISEQAITGAYFFSSSDVVRKTLPTLLSENRSGEFFISEIFNHLLASRETVRQFNAEEVYSFGTPEELQNSLLRLQDAGNLGIPS